MGISRKWDTSLCCTVFIICLPCKFPHSGRAWGHIRWSLSHSLPLHTQADRHSGTLLIHRWYMWNHVHMGFVTGMDQHLQEMLTSHCIPLTHGNWQSNLSNKPNSHSYTCSCIAAGLQELLWKEITYQLHSLFRWSQNYTDTVQVDYSTLQRKLKDIQTDWGRALNFYDNF